MTCGAIAVRPDSEVYTLQQLANVPVGVPYHAGTHYLAVLLLEGFLPRDAIKTCLAPNGARRRFDALMNGEIEATTLTEPYITVAERAGCRIVASSFYHGTEVATPEVDGMTYLAFNRAVREAVTRINADKPRYLQYFIDYHKSDPRVAELTVADLRPSRLQVANPVSHSGGRASPHLRMDEGLEHAAGRHLGRAGERGSAAACPRLALGVPDLAETGLRSGGPFRFLGHRRRRAELGETLLPPRQPVC